MKREEFVSSRRHPLVKELRAVRDERDSPYLFLEGPRLVQEALNSRQKIDLLVWTPSAGHDALLQAAMAVSGRGVPVSETVFEAVSDVQSPQGILALAARSKISWHDLLVRSPGPIVILDGVQDPGNLAAIVRTAEAAGAAGVVTTPGTAHLYSPKALRGAMGSSLRLACLEHQAIPRIYGALKKASRKIFAAAAATAATTSAEKPSLAYTLVDWEKPAALLFGREGSGLSPDWNLFVDAWLQIPMRPPVESLNVAAAAAILLYEYARCRKKA